MVKRLIVYLGIIPLVFGLLYIFSVVFMLLGVYRLTAMSVSAFVAPALAWMIFPLVFWRPLTFKGILISLVCVFFGYGVAVIFRILNISLPYDLSGPYGLFNLLIYSLFPAIFFEWIIRYRQN